MTVTNSEIGAYVDSLSDVGTPASDDELLIYDVSATTTKKVQASALSGGGGGGALVFLEAHTASTSAQLDFTSFISSTYDEYLFDIVDLHLATDNVNLLARMGTGAGPTYDTGSNYAWAGFRYAHNGSAAAGSTGTTSLGLDASGGIDNGANYGLSGAFRLFNPQSATYKRFIGQLSYIDNALSPLGSQFSGLYLSTTAVTAIRFLASSGNITDGTIRVYGVAKS